MLTTRSARGLLEESGAIDKDVTFILDSRPLVVDFQLPLPAILIPVGISDLGVQCHKIFQAPLGSGVLHVLPDLGTTGVEGRPVRVRFKREDIGI